MKLRKIITMGLAAMMAVSAMSISAFADNTSVARQEIENAKVITEQTEDGGTITVTYDPNYKVEILDYDGIETRAFISVDDMKPKVGTGVWDLDGENTFRDKYNTSTADILYSNRQYIAKKTSMYPVVMPDNKQSISVDVMEGDVSTGRESSIAYVDLNNTSAKKVIRVSDLKLNNHYYFKVINTSDSDCTGMIEVS